MAKQILLATLCGVEVRPESLVLDRKFHTGMLEYVKRLDGTPLACCLPALSRERMGRGIDNIEVPLQGLPYKVHPLAGDWDVTTGDAQLLERLVKDTAVAYVDDASPASLRLARLCKAAGVPYVVVTEYTFENQRTIEGIEHRGLSLPRRLVRRAKLHWRGRQRTQLIRGAAAVHCNGYPTFNELVRIAPRKRLLYFDSRVTLRDMIAEGSLLRRVALSGPQARLVFSGRYCDIKGALDAVQIGLELCRRGLAFRFDFYGSGDLRDAMVSRIREADAIDRLFVHAPVPYPELMELVKRADLAINCNVQSDPSCTYLETLACGVPIVGYDNDAWRPLFAESGAGRLVPIGDIAAAADGVLSLLAHGLLVNSLRARDFALAHTMERAWDDRVADLLSHARRSSGRPYTFSMTLPTGIPR